jgi:hypothetical protein
LPFFPVDLDLACLLETLFVSAIFLILNFLTGGFLVFCLVNGIFVLLISWLLFFSLSEETESSFRSTAASFKLKLLSKSNAVNLITLFFCILSVCF